MCEPYHSIVQFPNDPRVDAIPQSGEGFFSWAKKKIGAWFHFSKLGLGHSESLGVLNPSARLYLPQDTKYESGWWDRQVKLDGYFHGERFDAQEALDCATVYANRVSIGDLHLLRQFLEVSTRKSDRPQAYISQFPEILNPEGRDVYSKKIKSIGMDLFRTSRDLAKNVVDSAIKVMLGLTRKRDLMRSEWADDTKLWVPV